jgi:kynurenine---oxoglutarate transaminase / cysteine-S-conjugate beta-lyase / glutamine---phenylpyruvate transaminase
VSDEVYKFTVYNPLENGDETAKGHYHFARLPGLFFHKLVTMTLLIIHLAPGMWDRSITLSSCGKTFSVTGWQVGWMVAPQKYIKPIQDMIPCVQFCASTPVQQALTVALKQAEAPYQGFDR